MIPSPQVHVYVVVFVAVVFIQTTHNTHTIIINVIGGFVHLTGIMSLFFIRICHSVQGFKIMLYIYIYRIYIYKISSSGVDINKGKNKYLISPEVKFRK